MLVGELGREVKEIVISGRPNTPLNPIVAPLGLQMVACPGAWGVRSRTLTHTRGGKLEAVLRVHNELVNN